MSIDGGGDEVDRAREFRASNRMMVAYVEMEKIKKVIGNAQNEIEKLRAQALWNKQFRIQQEAFGELMEARKPPEEREFGVIGAL